MKQFYMSFFFQVDYLVCRSNLLRRGRLWVLWVVLATEKSLDIGIMTVAETFGESDNDDRQRPLWGKSEVWRSSSSIKHQTGKKTAKQLFKKNMVRKFDGVLAMRFIIWSWMNQSWMMHHRFIVKPIRCCSRIDEECVRGPPALLCTHAWRKALSLNRSFIIILRLREQNVALAFGRRVFILSVDPQLNPIGLNPNLHPNHSPICRWPSASEARARARRRSWTMFRRATR